jgi:hypothetical protein
MIIKSDCVRSAEYGPNELNELDIALMDMDELVLWTGGHVYASNYKALMQELEPIRPGITAAARDRYRDTDI